MKWIDDAEYLFTQKGMTLSEIARVVNKSPQNIGERLRARGVDTYANRGAKASAIGKAFAHRYINGAEFPVEARRLARKLQGEGMTPIEMSYHIVNVSSDTIGGWLNEN